MSNEKVGWDTGTRGTGSEARQNKEAREPKGHEPAQPGGGTAEDGPVPAGAVGCRDRAAAGDWKRDYASLEGAKEATGQSISWEAKEGGRAMTDDVRAALLGDHEAAKL